MKNFFLLIILLINLSALSQNDSKTYYSAKAIHISFIDNAGKILLNKPDGNNVEIIYDNFFKSYYITYYTEDNKYVYNKYSYIRENEYGTKTMYDDNNNKNIFHVTDSVVKDSRIVIQLDQKINGLTCFYIISDVVKKK